MSQDRDHEFGSQDTEIKLKVLRDYLTAYATALRPHFDAIWYIDAFAGTGSRTIKRKVAEASLLNEPETVQIQRQDGSARIALSVRPKFDRLIFIDSNEAHCASLDSLRSEFPSREIGIHNGDANEIIQRSIKPNWQGWESTRAVMFLDPYGMEVAWETLQIIAKTKAIDVWYLFPMSGLYRQAAKRLSDVDEHKEKALNWLLGSSDWKNELYTQVAPTNDLLEGMMSNEERVRKANVKQLEEYVKSKLETIFATVLEPLPLPVSRGPQMFSLFCAIANPSTRAENLAKRFGSQILAAGRSSQVRSR